MPCCCLFNMIIWTENLSCSLLLYLDGTTKRRKLELVSQYSLFGNIECLRAVRLAGNSRDSLLLSFKDAKVFSSYSSGNSSVYYG